MLLVSASCGVAFGFAARRGGHCLRPTKSGRFERLPLEGCPSGSIAILIARRISVRVAHNAMTGRRKLFSICRCRPYRTMRYDAAIDRTGCGDRQEVRPEWFVAVPGKGGAFARRPFSVARAIDDRHGLNGSTGRRSKQSRPKRQHLRPVPRSAFREKNHRPAGKYSGERCNLALRRSPTFALDKKRAVHPRQQTEQGPAANL